VVAKISQRLAFYFGLKAKTKNLKPKLVVAHDARLSSPRLYKTVLKTLKPKTYNLKPIPVGLATTPMFYFLVRQQKASGGIMITASHLPKNYNGLKVVDKNALSISGREIKKLFKL
jgi:phosphomannomutase